MIHERRRLIPTMIAVIIGVAFMASTLMLMDSIKASTLRTQAAAVGDAVGAAGAEADMRTPVSRCNNAFDAMGVVPRHTSVPGTVPALLLQEDPARRRKDRAEGPHVRKVSDRVEPVRRRRQ